MAKKKQEPKKEVKAEWVSLKDFLKRNPKYKAVGSNLFALALVRKES